MRVKLDIDILQSNWKYAKMLGARAGIDKPFIAVKKQHL